MGGSGLSRLILAGNLHGVAVQLGLEGALLVLEFLLLLLHLIVFLG